MHLAYLDDSDTKQKKFKWQVMSGVIIEDKAFKLTESGMAIVPELLIPLDKISMFEEFHACELYGGFGVFEGIDQDIRFDAIRRLLFVLEVAELSVVYGAVDLERLKNEIYASADPLDICFRACVRGIDTWADQDMDARLDSQLRANNISYEKLTDVVPHLVDGLLGQLTILIVDECDKKPKETLQRSYHSLRPARIKGFKGNLSNFHDDMYFGDSRYSIGIQLADLCSYFIARHLQGDDETESFYEMINPHIVYSQIHPPEPTKETATPSEIAIPEELPDGE